MEVLERMDAFFENRLEGYDAHMLCNIAGAGEFYPFTAAQLPMAPNAKVLDLGCGTGLELQWYFESNPTAEVTGIDLSAAMLRKLQEKFPDNKLNLICGSYFDTPFPAGFDGAVSVESLHHFAKAEKIPLYRKLYASLRSGGCFIRTDYFSLSEEEEQQHRQNLLALRKAQNLDADTFYHYDTPLTIQNETDALLAAGFQKVEILKNWGATYTLKAVKGEEEWAKKM